MNRILKWVAVAVGAVVSILVIAIAILAGIGGTKVNRTLDVSVATVAIPTDAASIERGKHFIESVGLCQECHGEKLEGQVVEEDPLFGRFAPPNLTSGKGGVAGDLSDDDYVRAIRHGVGRDGKALFIMNSDLYNKIGDEDLGAIIAYLKNLPPVDNEVARVKIGLIARALTAVDEEALFPANQIDHNAARDITPVIGVTAEYGGYLATVCTLCHGENLGGGSVPGESNIIAPNLTSSGTLGGWSEPDFISTIRNGVTPGRNKLDEENMPWDRFKLMTDDELKAIWLYVSSVPPAPPPEG